MEIEVDGLEHLQQRMSHLMQSLENGTVIRPAVAAGLRIMSRQMRVMAPIRRRRVRKRVFRRLMQRKNASRARAMWRASVVTNKKHGTPGDLKRAIKYRVSRKTSRTFTVGKTGINVAVSADRQVPHAHLVGLGTKARTTKKRKQKRGTMPRNDFVLRAASLTANAALTAIDAMLLDGVAKAVVAAGGTP